jgi:hypothetical protein
MPVLFTATPVTPSRSSLTHPVPIPYPSISALTSYKFITITITLYNSIIKIRWELRWFEEDHEAEAREDGEGEGGEGQQGRWVQSIGRYYIRIANQLLVEDEETGYVIVMSCQRIDLLYVGV